ncbi:hypothetical protein T4C_6435 [Trichinella pseudospiralis]|uniref:Uncharacterized protein n=1 Tax=Trichinella pseudospiralis TaxID=6337 RepID=A0A0V1IMF3_TRIPS|nr:hypothetical protein T4C_6435 [Trichinella pseudospiralis]
MSLRKVSGAGLGGRGIFSRKAQISSLYKTRTIWKFSPTLLGRRHRQSPLPLEQGKSTSCPHIQQQSLTHLFSAECLGVFRSRVGERAPRLSKEQGKSLLSSLSKGRERQPPEWGPFLSLQSLLPLNISSPTLGMSAISQSSFMPDFISLFVLHCTFIFFRKDLLIKNCCCCIVLGLY